MSADCTAMRAVSTSRISPTRITSGSWRRIDLSPVANVSPACSLVWIWLTWGKRTRLGPRSLTLRVGLLTSLSVAYSVVVFPLPVGPAQSIMPKGARTIFEYIA